MMKKLLIGLFAVLCAGGASAQQLDVNGQVNNVTPKVVAKSGVLSNVLGLDVKTQQNKKADSKFKTHYIWANASQMQQQVRQNMPMMSANGNFAKIAKAEKAATEALTWWGYDQAEKVATFGNDLLDQVLEETVFGGQNNYNVACVIPSNFAKAKIDSVAFLVSTSATYDNLTIWAAPYATIQTKDGYYYNPPMTADDATVKYTIPAAEVKATIDAAVKDGHSLTFIEAKLPKSFTIPAEGAFVGYSFDGKSSDRGIVAWYNGGTEGGLLYQYQYKGETVWDSFKSLGIGDLTTMIGMDASDCDANDAAVQAGSESTTLINTAQQYPFYITNNSAKPINQITYTITIDNEEGEVQTLDLKSPIESMATASLPLKKSFEDEGVHTIELKVLKVNGNDNVNKNISASYSIIALEKSADRVSVVEEQTGTWCGWCPRGHVGLELLNKKLGDKVITLAGHFSGDETTVDPMNIYQLTNNSTQAEAFADYGWVTMQLSSMLGSGGFPGAMFDRLIAGDPYVGINTTKGKNGTYEFSADALVKTIQEQIPSEADFSMTASWADDKNTDIKVDLTTTFNYDRFGEFPYGVAFVLSENGMTGKGATWKQTNYYSKLMGAQGASDYNNPDMSAWFKGGSYVSTTYDNVVVQAWNPLGNAAIVDKSKTDIIKGEAIPFSATLKVNSDLIQNYDNLTLSALLVNLKSYAVVNAAKVVLGKCAAGIEDVNSEANNNVVSRYNVNGMHINGAQKGLNIVKLANGKVVKMAVK